MKFYVPAFFLIVFSCLTLYATEPVKIEKKEVVFGETYYNGTNGYYLVGTGNKGSYGNNAAVHNNRYNPYVQQEVNEEEYTPTEVDTKVFHIFANNCASCHGKEKQSGKLQLIDGKELLLHPLHTRVEIVDRVTSHDLKDRGKKPMPMGGETELTKEEKWALMLWMVQESDNMKQRYKKEQK